MIENSEDTPGGRKRLCVPQPCSPFDRILITVHLSQYLYLYLHLKDNGNEHLVTWKFEGGSVLGGFILKDGWNAHDNGRANENHIL